MKRVMLSIWGAMMNFSTFAFNGRKGVSDDQLLAFTASLITVLLLIGFSKEIVVAVRKLFGKRHI
ncbi:hypothetical protein AEM51_13365 [Bacteroidetes bacterium UKL13-3]|jgi:hypothetical protein|nr:hypothetical protein AEM51_13365 [Bacteroidetes bacterium UKL13-3]HCP93820.1 hypothetical protein [Bacteroidota bacterium]